MAEQYRFFGSAVGDTREYSQVEFAEVFGTIVGNGYLGQVESELVTTENTPVGMSVLVGTGQAWINGYWYSNETPKEIPIATADATNHRIDRVVLRLDVLNARSIVAVVKTGTPASTPVAPTLTQTEQMWEIPLYQVYVAPAVLAIYDEDLTDERYQALLQDTDEILEIVDNAVNTIGQKTGNSTAIGYQALNVDDGTTNNNTAFGYQSLAANTIGYYNTAIGYQSLTNSTTGTGNSAIGANALLNNTTGSYNIANGFASLINNTTGSNNIALGSYSSMNNSTGGNNVAIGWNSLRNSTTGSINVAIGDSSGRYIADGTTANTTCDYSVYLGSLTKPLADDDQNEIVIGYNATGAGSNTATIGNSSITRVYRGTQKLAEENTYPATIPSTSWTGSSAPYSKAVTVTGILSTDAPIIDIVQTGTYATDQTMISNWGNIYRAVTSANTITFYATAVPSADISIQVKVVR